MTPHSTQHNPRSPSWRDTILNEFVPNVSKLTLVADPDSLLTEERLALELRQRGFELIEFNDPIEFRFAYESKFRSIWDRGEHTDLVVILRLQDSALDSLPYDLLQAGRKLAFNLGDLFPNLSYPVIEKLDRNLLDALYEAQTTFVPERMGDNATKDFILRHVFGIAGELVTSQVDLLRVLLRLHYSHIRMAPTLVVRLVQVLKTQSAFLDWPMADIVSDTESFFAFLQERWPVYLDSHGKTDGVREAAQAQDYGFKFPGPARLPFDHHDIRVYIDNLFVEGKLTPIHRPDLVVAQTSWIRCGIVEKTELDNSIRILRLFERVGEKLPAPPMNFADWLTFAQKWAELSAMTHCIGSESDKHRLVEIGATVNEQFAAWLGTHYSSLINLPPTNPAMLHHVPRRLARELEASNSAKIALIVVDGLALDQWVTVRSVLQEQDRNLVIRESATFAWIPTLTSVSRQSIFSGKPPMFFPSSIQTTNNEGNLWRQFWEGMGINRLDIAYERGLGNGSPADTLERILNPGQTRAVGLVVDKVDKIMHGMQLGAAGMHSQVKQWCQGGFLGALIGNLLDHGFGVWMTSDHGNIECSGKGRPSEGVIAETRGERARVYPTPELRSQVAAAFTFARTWDPVGLPPGYFPLFASGNDAFLTSGETAVAHGGIAVEEVIVPLIKFERQTR